MNEKLKAYEEKMTKTMGNLDGELGAIRAGRANPHVLETDRYISGKSFRPVTIDAE